ncbi:MAG: FtsX-like permease family protein, partial [Muribaculaceae bacterium]|nr:FtsX-like permease family protein [Muribaculaceae bacterium]
NVLRTGASYYSWLDLLDTNVVVILVLMSLVAAFTLISSLFILILERVRMIGTLKSLGATNGQIRGIFIYMAEKLMLRGLLIGNLIGLGLIWIQHTTHILPLDADAYYLNHVPAEISWQAVLLLNLSVIVVSVLVLILPSHLISTLSPSESIRYE